MNPKLLYQVDGNNKLIIRKSSRKSSLKKFRQVIDGRFKVDKKNNIYYQVMKSCQADIPSRIKFSGKYNLDPDHNLVISLSKKNNKKIKLRTKISGIKGNSLVLDLNSYALKLTGSWSVDARNRLTFGVKRVKNKEDDLVLSGAWNLDKNNQIIYRASHVSGSIALKGRWTVKNRHKISYEIDKRHGSFLDFKISGGQIVPKNKKTYFVFNVNIFISRTRRIKRKLTFEVKTKINKDTKIILGVKPNSKRINLRLDRNILKRKGILFLESFLTEKEKYIGGGIVFRW